MAKKACCFSCAPTWGPTMATLRMAKLETKKPSRTESNTAGSATPFKSSIELRTPPFVFVLIVNDGLGLGRIALAGIGAGMKRIFIHQVIGQGQVAGIVQVLLAGREHWFPGR